jgi:hypothetical protein
VCSLPPSQPVLSKLAVIDIEPALDIVGRLYKLTGAEVRVLQAIATRGAHRTGHGAGDFGIDHPDSYEALFEKTERIGKSTSCVAARVHSLDNRLNER